MDASLRRSRILLAAVHVAERVGIDHINATEVAAEAGCCVATVYRRFGTHQRLRAAVIEHARARGLVTLLATSTEHRI